VYRASFHSRPSRNPNERLSFIYDQREQDVVTQELTSTSDRALEIVTRSLDFTGIKIIIIIIVKLCTKGAETLCTAANFISCGQR